MYKVGYIFYDDEYEKIANFCNQNFGEYDFIEIEPDEKGERYQLIEAANPTQEEQKQNLRWIREDICYPIINRGELWYKTLTEGQMKELENWYKDWLDVTETLIIPKSPEWLK